MLKVLMTLVLAFCIVNFVTAQKQFEKKRKILGGNVAAIGQFPHAAYLILHLMGSMASFCGGSIINQNYLLTVRILCFFYDDCHCFRKFPPCRISQFHSKIHFCKDSNHATDNISLSLFYNKTIFNDGNSMKKSNHNCRNNFRRHIVSTTSHELK